VSIVVGMLFASVLIWVVFQTFSRLLRSTP